MDYEWSDHSCKQSLLAIIIIGDGVCSCNGLDAQVGLNQRSFPGERNHSCVASIPCTHRSLLWVWEVARHQQLVQLLCHTAINVTGTTSHLLQQDVQRNNLPEVKAPTGPEQHKKAYVCSVYASCMYTLVSILFISTLYSSHKCVLSCDFWQSLHRCACRHEATML